MPPIVRRHIREHRKSIYDKDRRTTLRGGGARWDRAKKWLGGIGAVVGVAAIGYGAYKGYELVNGVWQRVPSAIEVGERIQEPGRPSDEEKKRYDERHKGVPIYEHELTDDRPPLSKWKETGHTGAASDEDILKAIERREAEKKRNTGISNEEMMRDFGGKSFEKKARGLKGGALTRAQRRRQEEDEEISRASHRLTGAARE